MDYFMMSRNNGVAENDLNEWVGCIRVLVGDTATAFFAGRSATTSNLSWPTIALVMTDEEMSVTTVKAVKSGGQEKAEVGEEMSLIKVKAT